MTSNYDETKHVRDRQGRYADKPGSGQPSAAGVGFGESDDWRGDPLSDVRQHQMADVRELYHGAIGAEYTADVRPTLDRMTISELHDEQMNTVMEEPLSFKSDDVTADHEIVITDDQAFAGYIVARTRGERRARSARAAAEQFGVPEGRELFEHGEVTEDIGHLDSNAPEEAADMYLSDYAEAEDREQSLAELRAYDDLAAQLGYRSSLPAQGHATEEQVIDARNQIVSAFERFDGHPLVGVNNTNSLSAFGEDEGEAEGIPQSASRYMDWERFGRDRMESRGERVTLGGHDYYALTNN